MNDRDTAFSPRDLFLMPSASYFAAHSVGCLSRAGHEASFDFFEQWKSSGTNAWTQWLGDIERFLSALGGLLNAKADAFCPQPSVTAAVSKVFKALPKRKGRHKILMGDLDFPSLGFLLTVASKEEGCSLEIMKNENGRYPLPLWESHLREDVQLVLITHVLSGNSFRNDVSSVLAAAKKKGIFTVVDVSQSAGVVPIDLSEWNADFVAGSCIKWLCGGPGTGFLWQNPERLSECFPKDVGWFAHENPFEFDIHQFRYANDAKRYMMGTPSILPYAVASRSIELLSRIGVRNRNTHRAITLFKRAHRLQRFMIELLDLLETMSPKEYQEIRLVLGNGSGQTSPGFRAFNQLAPSMWDAYLACYLSAGDLTLDMVYDSHYSHDGAYVIAEALIELDALHQRFYKRHFELIERTIGGKAKSLKGRDVEKLQRGEMLFPRLWEIRNKMTASWGQENGYRRESISAAPGCPFSK